MAGGSKGVVRAGRGLLRTVKLLLLSMVCVLSWTQVSCRQDAADSPSPEKRETSPRPQEENPDPQSSAKKPPIDEEMKNARIRPRAVGGCGEACSDHKESIQAYFQSLYGETSKYDTIDFLETSEMVFNGKRLGDRWVALWKGGQLAERTKEIQSFSDEIHQWASKVSPEELEQAVMGGISFGEDDGPGYLVFFRHPSFEGDDTLPVWRYRVQARGWEWLISEIQTKESL